MTSRGLQRYDLQCWQVSTGLCLDKGNNYARQRNSDDSQMTQIVTRRKCLECSK